MPLLSIFIALVLGVLALGFVLYPLYRHRLTNVGKPATRPTARVGPTFHVTLLSSGSQASLEHEQAARIAIQEVELDYQLGNISESDYRTLRERYLRRALVAMKSRYDHEQELDDTIEAQLRTLRDKA